LPDLATKIRANLIDVKDRIASAARRSGRPADTVRLVAVTKAVGLEEVRILHDLGQRDFGENRVLDAQPKIESFQSVIAEQDRPCWHMIGNLQRRKARLAVSLFDCVDSVDRLDLAQTLNRRCEEAGRRLSILVEVNVSSEASKHGLAPNELPSTLDALRNLEHLKVQGLMTMAPFEQDPEATRPVFAKLRELSEEFDLPELSMGMSNDFDVAVEEGATQVRIGTTLFT
jgi:pyridoxal phosphate enzyme (YggS family)